MLSLPCFLAKQEGTSAYDISRLLSLKPRRAREGSSIDDYHSDHPSMLQV